MLGTRAEIAPDDLIAQALEHCVFPLAAAEVVQRDGPKIYVRPDQVDAMRTRIDTAARQDGQLHPEQETRNVTISVNGQNYTMTSAQFRSMLDGHGTYGGT